MQILKKLYLTRKEVSKLLNVSVTALQNWYRYPEMCTPGFPRATRLSKRVYRYETKDVYDFMEKTGRNKRFAYMAKGVVSEIPQAMTPIENNVPHGTFEEETPKTPTETMALEKKINEELASIAPGISGIFDISALEAKPQARYETKTYVAADSTTYPPTIVEITEQGKLIKEKEPEPIRMPYISSKDF